MILWYDEIPRNMLLLKCTVTDKECRTELAIMEA